MAQQFGSVAFPFRQDLQRLALARTTDVNSTIAVAVRCYLLTVPGQRRGNNVGSFLTYLKHTLIANNALVGIQDNLKKDLIAQFPGVIFNQVILTQSINESTRSNDLTVQLSFQTATTTVANLTLLV